MVAKWKEEKDEDDEEEEDEEAEPQMAGKTKERKWSEGRTMNNNQDACDAFTAMKANRGEWKSRRQD